MQSRREQLAIRIVISYLVVGVAWILISDTVANSLLGMSPETLQRAQGFKGIAFIAVTSVLLYVLVRNGVKEIVMAHDALLESEERLTLFLRNMPGIAMIKDEAGRYVSANEEAESFFKLPAKQIYGKTNFDFFPLELASKFRSQDEVVLVTGAPSNTVETVNDREGNFVTWLIHRFRIVDTGNHRFVVLLAVRQPLPTLAA